MSLKSVAGKVLLFIVIEIGALVGVPMRPDEIEKLMRMTENKIVTIRQEDDDESRTRTVVRLRPDRYR